MADDKTFTQAEMDSIIEGRLARERQKYADYDDLKEKASKYDEYQAQNKTELQKEKEKSDALQAKLSALEKKDTVRQVREKTAKDTGVPVELLTGEDEETCKKQAEAIMKFAKPKSYPALISSDFEIPAEISQGIFEKAQKGSTLAQLSGARPQKFGKQQVWVLTSPPKAELVGEAGQKSPTPTAYASKTVNPFKLQVTTRFSQEVQWADEDVQIGVLQDLASNASIALGRALDLVGIHKINPLTGTVSSLVKEGLVDTKQSVQLAGTKYDEAIEAAAGMIISSGYVPSGIAMDPTLSFGLSTMRDADGRKIYPEIGFGQNLTNFSGMTAAVSDTVSAKNEITPDTKLLGIVGQFDAFRWGVQRSIGAHLIEYGDPDGLGDLQRQNQIAIRAEIVYGIGIMDQAAFTKIVKAEG